MSLTQGTSEGSPQKKTITSSFLTGKVPDAKSIRLTKAKHMRDHMLWLGPMDPQKFLDTFMTPSQPGYKSPGKRDLGRFGRFVYQEGLFRDEKALAEAFIEYFDNFTNKETLFPKTYIKYGDRMEPKTNSRLRIDTNIYCGNLDPESLNSKPVQVERSDVAVEWKKLASSDPFAKSSEDLIKDTDASKIGEGQLVGYVDLLANYQYRTHIFQLLMCGNTARFLRYDHSAAIVTESFTYTDPKQSGFLVQFFHRLSRLSQAQLGRDMRYSTDIPAGLALDTASAAQKVIAEAQEALQTVYKSRKSTNNRPLTLLTTEDDEGKLHELILWYHVRERDSIIGRATRAFPVYHTERKKVMFYKEGWRLSEVNRESEILRMLNRKHIPHVPTLVTGGDIPGHDTESQEYVNCSWNRNTSRSVCLRKQHFILIEEVGTPVHEFESAQQFLAVTCDAFIAHQQAFSSLKLLHRDISLGNIIRLDDGSGMLIDWEMAKTLEELDQAPVQPWRSGTWQFLSATLCEFGRKKHQLQDDLESFVHVVMYTTLRYMRHNYDQTKLQENMEKIYDEGGDHKLAMFVKGLGRYMSSALVLQDAPPLVSWIERACNLAKEWLLSVYASVETDPVSQATILVEPGSVPNTIGFHDHTALLELWKSALGSEDWNKVTVHSACDNMAKISASQPKQRASEGRSLQPPPSESAVAAQSEEKSYKPPTPTTSRKRRSQQDTQSAAGSKKQRLGKGRN